MIKRVLIIGGYGNFGGFIAGKLALNPKVQLIIAGRDRAKAAAFASEIQTIYPPETAYIDIRQEITPFLAMLRPDIVIHTSGPYQDQSYRVAQACIEQSCHYIDLSDARSFVAGIKVLDKEAKAKGILICSGASSVPCLTSAIINHYIDRFEILETVEYAIATAQLTNRGLATTAAGLSYAGKGFKTLIDGQMRKVHGWLGLTWRKFWGLGLRPLGFCDIPDLELFPQMYPTLRTIHFQAGLELKPLHLVLWFLSYLVRYKLFPPLRPLAPYFLKISHLFDPFGHDDSGFYMKLSGADKRGHPQTINFDLVARHGDGLYIPSMPAILMAEKLINGQISRTGAIPCMGFITLEEYLHALQEFNIQWRTTSSF